MQEYMQKVNKGILFAAICYGIFSFWIFLAGTKETSARAENEMNIDCYMDIKKVAITFDDGPRESTTEKLLDGLAERDVVATFFVVGENVLENKDLIERMYKDGHLIGNHTHSHCNLRVKSCNDAKNEINLASQSIYETIGIYSEFLRPPYGACSEEFIKNINMFEILWDIDPLDWVDKNTEKIVRKVTSKVKDGDIILLHDIYDTSVEAALQIVDILKSEGYEFVTVEELLLP